MDELGDFTHDALIRELWTVDTDVVDGTPITQIAFIGGPSDTAFRILGAVGQAFTDHLLDGDHDLLTFDANHVSVDAATAVLDRAFAEATSQT
ncbi:MAG: hypothetical protein R2733_01125 [Acidimicrobiales bacterium]